MKDLAMLLVVLARLIAGALSTPVADPASFYCMLATMIAPLPFGLLAAGRDRLYVVATPIVLAFTGIAAWATEASRHRSADRARAGR